MCSREDCWKVQLLAWGRCLKQLSSDSLNASAMVIATGLKTLITGTRALFRFTYFARVSCTLLCDYLLGISCMNFAGIGCVLSKRSLTSFALVLNVNRFFKDDEIDTIRKTTFYDVLTTIGIQPAAVQKNVFVWNAGKYCSAAALHCQ